MIPVNLNKNLVKKLKVKSKPKGIVAVANIISEKPGISRIIGKRSKIKKIANKIMNVLIENSKLKILNER